MVRIRPAFTLIELLVVILILAILMAIAVPLYLGAARESQRRTCRANTQTIAHAEQAYRIRSTGHVYTADLTDLIGLTEDLVTLPRCPADNTPESADYLVTINEDGTFTVFCNSNDGDAAALHNLTKDGPDRGYTPGIDSE